MYKRGSVGNKIKFRNRGKICEEETNIYISSTVDMCISGMKCKYQ